MGRRVFGRMPRWLTAAAVGLAACALLMGPVLLFGAFTLRTSLEDLNARGDRERQGAAALAVSMEPPGGSPTGQPTGALVCSGMIAPVKRA